MRVLMNSLRFLHVIIFESQVMPVGPISDSDMTAEVGVGNNGEIFPSQSTHPAVLRRHFLGDVSERPLMFVLVRWSVLGTEVIVAVAMALYRSLHVTHHLPSRQCNCPLTHCPDLFLRYIPSQHTQTIATTWQIRTWAAGASNDKHKIDYIV